MTLGDTRYTRCFRIGVVPVRIDSTDRGVIEQYTSLYRSRLVDDAGERAVRVSIRRPPRPLWHRRRYDVIVGERVQFEPARRAEVLPYVEWAINWEVPRALPEYLQLHASSMQVDGAGVIFPGESGSGKSTLTAGLLARGWKYLCDEFALIHAETLELHPFPRAICIKKPSLPIVARLGLSAHRNQHHIKGGKGLVGFIDPLALGPDGVGEACPIRFVIFPKYVAGAMPTLEAISRAEAAFDLHRVCFNLFSCRAVGLDVIAGMIRGAACYRLVAGALRATCDLVERVVRGAA